MTTTAHDIAIAAHEHAAMAFEAAWERPSKRTWADAVAQATTAREETEAHAWDIGAAVAATREAEEEARRAADAHAARDSQGRRMAARWAAQATETAIAAIRGA